MFLRMKSPLRSRVHTAIEELHLPGLDFAIDALNPSLTNNGYGGITSQQLHFQTT